MTAPWWIAMTYLVYVIIFDGGILGVGFYLVLRGHSGWWVLGCVAIACCTISTQKWRRLWKRDASEKEDP